MSDQIGKAAEAKMEAAQAAWDAAVVLFDKAIALEIEAMRLALSERYLFFDGATVEKLLDEWYESCSCVRYFGMGFFQGPAIMECNRPDPRKFVNDTREILVP